MKKILIIPGVFFFLNTSAQFSLEHVYDNAATINYCAGATSQLMYLKLEASGERFVKVNRCQKLLSLYDVNHTLVKNISLSYLPVNSVSNKLSGSIIYISEKLFNTDPKLEFMFCDHGVGTMICSEDGTILFSDPAGMPWIMPNYHQQQYPIYNTSTGTKMILSYSNGDAKVFGLTGTLTATSPKPTGDGTGYEVAQDYLAVAPNPVTEISRMNYVLPEGVAQGEIVIYDLQAKEIKRFQVDSTFDHLLLSAKDLASGTYFYQLVAAGKSCDSKKLVVIH